MIDWYLLVGTSNSLILNPRQSQGGSLHVYRIHAGERFEYLHTTYTEDAPTAITPFQVKLRTQKFKKWGTLKVEIKEDNRNDNH